MNNAPIGIFDSGVGGLTVARAVIDQLPNEEIIYIGDTKHVPYGTKSLDQVRAYALEVMDELVSRGVKMLVIACNTASSAVLHDARHRYQIPVVEVIGPAARAAAAISRNKKVGVIATPATVRSRAYEDVLSVVPGLTVFQQACPRFVELVESGVTSGADAIQTAHEYLDPIKEQGIDTLVLGCTHYPHLQGVISYVMGPEVALVSSSDETAKDIYTSLARTDSFRDPQAPPPVHQFLTTGPNDAFSRLATRFIGPALGEVKTIENGKETA
ncbi:glutamate racemase [Boudabousia liubingyangii]|uniref:glutamate racemase n=1 Tax=Boudabousia liubingyangii TaxID=1921764 RepID=UPI00093F45E8|nr:glutamate racemase [Boudabousia liubingyangii]